MARLARGQALEQLGRHHEALQEFVEAERAAPDSVPVMSSVVGALAATGQAREARRRVAEIERRARSTFFPAFELGLMRVALGDIDLAFDWLRRSCDIKEPRLTAIGFHRGVDPIRQDPRFAELLACVGLPVNAASSRQDLLEAERAAPDNFPVLSSVVGALAATGDVRDARRRVAEAERLARSTFVPAFDLGVMRLALGDIDLAFDWLRRSCDMKETRLATIGFDPGVDPIRRDPRFTELLACVGLPAAPRRAPADPSVGTTTLRPEAGLPRAPR